MGRVARGIEEGDDDFAVRIGGDHCRGIGLAYSE
jgi:hypothetical protein